MYALFLIPWTRLDSLNVCLYLAPIGHIHFVPTNVKLIETRKCGVTHHSRCFKSELFTDLLARANALREAILIRDGIFALFNTNHLSIDEVNYLIESLVINLN